METVRVNKKKKKKPSNPFPEANQFWKLRSKHGPNPTFSSSEKLAEACYEYFEAVSSNPLQAAELVKSGTKSKVAYTPKMRVMTIQGLVVFLGVSVSTWYRWKEKGSDLREICLQMEAVMYSQAIEGAAAGMLSPSIIARKLGLADKIEHGGDGGGPVEIAPSAKLGELLDRLAPVPEKSD